MSLSKDLQQMVLQKYLEDFDWYSLSCRSYLRLADVDDTIMIQELKFVSTTWWRIISDWYKKEWGVLSWNRLVNIFPIYDFGPLPEAKRNRLQVAREFFYSFIGCCLSDDFGFTQKRPDTDSGRMIVGGKYQTVEGLENVHDQYTCSKIQTSNNCLYFELDAHCSPIIRCCLSENYDINVEYGKLSDKISLNCSWTKNPFHYQNIDSPDVICLMNYPKRPIVRVFVNDDMEEELNEFDPTKLMTRPGQLVRYDLTRYQQALRKVVITLLCVYHFAETELSALPLEVIIMIAKSIYND